MTTAPRNPGGPLCVLLGIFPILAEASVGNIVDNGSFERVTTNPIFAVPPWNCIGDFGGQFGGLFSLIPGRPPQGVSFAFFRGFLYQDLATEPGQDYLLSVWVSSGIPSVGNLPSDLRVFWGQTKIDDRHINSPTWTPLSYVVTATDTTTRLGFQVPNVSVSYLLSLDAVSVTPVPEPQIIPLIAIGSLVVFFAPSLRRRKSG